MNGLQTKCVEKNHSRHWSLHKCLNVGIKRTIIHCWMSIDIIDIAFKTLIQSSNFYENHKLVRWIIKTNEISVILWVLSCSRDSLSVVRFYQCSSIIWIFSVKLTPLSLYSRPPHASPLFLYHHLFSWELQYGSLVELNVRCYCCSRDCLSPVVRFHPSTSIDWFTQADNRWQTSKPASRYWNKQQLSNFFVLFYVMSFYFFINIFFSVRQKAELFF